MSEAKRRKIGVKGEPIGIDTYAGKAHVKWDPDAAVTPLRQLPFFIEFLKVSGLFDAFVRESPLTHSSPNAPDKRDVLAGRCSLWSGGSDV